MHAKSLTSYIWYIIYTSYYGSFQRVSFHWDMMQPHATYYLNSFKMYALKIVIDLHSDLKVRDSQNISFSDLMYLLG